MQVIGMARWAITLFCTSIFYHSVGACPWVKDDPRQLRHVHPELLPQKPGPFNAIRCDSFVDLLSIA